MLAAPALLTLVLLASPDFGAQGQSLCSSNADCPREAVCEDGVCVAPEPFSEPAPPPAELETDVDRRDDGRLERGTLLVGEACRKHYQCSNDLRCFKRQCTPRPPSTGTVMLIIGGGLSAVGALYMLSAPICGDLGAFSDFEGGCVWPSLLVGTISLAIGIPLLVIGLNQRSTRKAWLKEHRPDLVYTPLEGGGALSFTSRF